MAVRDYSGFQAIVNSVEKLRETVDREADKQLTIFRVIRDDQRLQLTALERMVEGLRSRSQTRNNFGFPDRLELKNIKLETRFVSLSARSVIVETKGGLSREKQSKTDSQQLAKALGSEIKKIKVGSGLGNPLQILGAGILFQFGAQFAKGFEKSIKKNIGLSFTSFGENVGTGVTDPKQAFKDTIKARRAWQVQKEALDQAIKQAEKETVKIDPDKENVFAIGGLYQRGGEGGSLVARQVREARGRKNVNVIAVKNPYSDPETELPDPKKPVQNIFKFLQGIGRDLESNLIKGYNPDAINLAAKIIAAKKKNPKANITIEGYSHGGYLVEEALEILKNAGITDVTGRGIGTPDLGIGFDNKNYKSYLGKTDKRAQDLIAQFFLPPTHKRSPSQRLDNIGTMVDLSDHDLDEYLKHPELIKDLQGESRSVSSQKIIKEFEKELNNKKQIIANIGLLPTGLSEQSILALKKEIEDIIAVVETMDLENIDPVLTTYKKLIDTLNKESDVNIKILEGQKGIEKLKLPNAPVENLAFSLSHRYRILSKVGEEDLLTPLNLASEIDQQSLYEWLEQAKVEAKNNAVILKKTTKKKLSLEEEEELIKRQFDAIAFANLHQGSMMQVLNKKVQQETKPNEPNQVPTRTDTPGRPDGSGNQPPDRNPDIVPVGPVELPPSAGNNVDTQADLPRGGGLAPLAGQLDTYQKTLRESLARVLEAQKAQTEIEIEPDFWVDVEQLNQGFVKRTQTQLILFWEKLRTNLGKEINRTLAGLLGTIPGAMLGRGLTGDPVGGYLGGMAGRLIAETGFQDVSNFRSLQEQGMSPATAEFWQQFGNNRKFLPNTLRKTAVGYVTGSVVGRGINDVMEVTGANQLIGALMPSWLETAIGDGINRTIKTIADPNIDLAIPHLPPAANKILSAPLHAVGKSVAAQGFLGNVATSFLDHQTKTALMPVREALTGVGQAIGGEGLLGEYLGDRFTGLGIGAIQNTAKASGRGVAGMIAPGLPAEVRNFIADQVIKQGVLDGTVRDQVAPFLASQAGTDVFARGFKVPVTGKIAGTINQTLDKYDPFAIAPKQSLTDEQILLNREQRLAKKRTNAINAVENLFNRIDKSVDETTKAVVGIGNGFLGFFDNIRTKTYDFAKKTAGLTDNPITLIDQYVVYLDQLVQDAQKQAEETVKGIIPDYKNLTIPERKEAIGSYKKKVATEVKKFRMAIEDGESQIALEIGENVLALVESTRKIYKDLLEAVPSDLSGTKSIQANQRYLTSVQTEVLKGQPNIKGRAKTGLMQLVGTETSEGFIKGIEERLNKVRNSGKELAESAIEGAKKRLGIASPSKEFEKLGESSGQGFEIGAVESLKDASKAILAEIEAIKAGIAKELKGIVKPSKLDKFLADSSSKALSNKGLDAVIYRLNNSFNLKPEHQKIVDKLALYGRTQKPSIIRMHGSDQKHKIGESVEFPSATSFTGKVDQVKKTGSLSYLKLQPGGSLYEVVNPRRGFDVSYDNSYTAPFAEEDETIASGKYKVVGKKQKTISVDYGEKDGIEKLKVTIYQLEEIRSEIDKSISLLSKPVAQLKSAFDNLGKDTIEGFVQGVQGNQSDAIEVIAELVDSVIEKAKNDLEIQSPSKKFRRMAQQSVAGFVQGLGEGEEEVKEAIGSFWDSLENIPILGWLVKAGRLIAKLIGDMFGSKKPSNQPKKQEPKELIDNSLYAKYVAYLDSLKTSSKQHTLKHIQSSQQYKDFKGLSREDQLKVTQQSFSEIKEQVKEFKEAIADGNKDLAFEVGETIVGATETLKLIYDDLIQEIEPDSDLAKQLEKEKKAVEKIQRQTIGNKRTKTGLTNLAREADRALEMGESVGDGFVQGIESKIEEAGIAAETLSEQVIKEAEKRLGIQSPSRVFEEIGQRVVEGFNLGFQAIQSAINTPIDQALTAVDNTFSAFIANAQQGFNDFVAQLEQDFPIFAELKDLILGLAAGFALNNIFELLVGQITALGDASFGAVLELESMRLALTSVTGSAEAGAKGLAFVREEAQRLGVELKTAEEAYTGFLAVTKYTVLQGKQADRIFSVFQETAARRGLSNEEQGRMFAAINQAISKRKLSAEEVRGQLGEIPGLAFESTVARSMGVNPAQLSEMMGDGLLMAEDVFPKVTALYEAENAKIAGGTETTTQALTRFQNAIVNLQRSFEGWIAPAKTFFNFFAAAIEKISEIIPIVVRYLGIFSAALFIDFAKISIELAKFLGGLKSVQAVLSVLARIAVAAFKLIYKELLIFLGQFALLTLAVDAVGAAIYVLSNNAFPELKKGIEEATTRVNQLEQALQNVGKATQAIPKELPKTEEEIVTTRNWNILGWDTGFNLEGTRQFLNNIDKAVGFEALGFEPALTTLGQQELANFQENVGGLVSQVDKNLSKQFDVEKTIKEIRELDKELTQARSRQFNIPAGDKKRYEAAIKEQQKLIEERDKKLSATASFEKALQGDKAEIEEYLKALDELVAKRGITEEAEKSIRAQLEQRLEDIDKTSTAFDDLMSNLQKSVNALTLALRTLNEQAAYFNETLQRNATNARVQFIRRARAAGVGSQVRDLGLEEIEQNTLEARIVFLRDQLGAVNEYLSKPDFADVLTELRQQAEDMGVNLENTATIDRLISENRSQQETAVLNTLKEQLRLQDELGQAEENLEQSISSTRSGITDLNNSVEEFFFNLTQRIDEAIVEVDRILNRLKYTDIKNRLQRALVPGSNTFVNGLVSQIQGIFDRASGIVEQLLGQRSARINFVGERRGLQSELENFTRNLGGATEALELFRQGLLGGQPSGGVGQPSASGRFSLGKIGSTGIGTGSHLDIRGRDAKGNIMSEARLREFFSQVYVDGKPLSEQLNKITSGYGIRRPPTQGASREHYAFDFGFPKGTPLEFRGAVSSARSYFTRGNGNTVELTLPTGEKLQFLHLDSVANLATIQRGGVNIPGNTLQQMPQNLQRGSNILVRRSGQKTPEGLEILQFDLVKDGKVVDTVIGGVTGRPSTQSTIGTNKTNIRGSETPLPDGSWSINRNHASRYLQQFNSGQLANYNPSQIPLGTVGPAWIGVEPNFSTGRSEIGFHLEDLQRGSAGCLVFTDPNQIAKIANWVVQSGAKSLYVDLDGKSTGQINNPGNTQRRGMPNVPFASLIESAARQAGIDPLLFAALVRKESGFRQEKSPGQILTSSAGAVGIAQLKRDTARELGVNPDKVAENLIGGAKYLARMLERFGGNIELALSAYKAGPGNVRNNQLARGTVRDVGIVMQYYREFQQASQVATADQPTPPTAPIPNVNNAAAEGLTNRLIQIKKNQVDLGDPLVRQEIEAFLIDLQQTQQDILRQMGDSIRQSTQSVIDAQNSLQDIRSQYSPQTQSAQLETELRGVENQFRDLDNQLFEQERGLTDNIQGLDKLLGQMKPILEILSASTNQVDKESASFLMGLIGRIEQDKATYSGMRTEIQQLRGQLKEGQIDAENFVRAQAKLRTIQSDLERIGTELSIAQEQNNLEQERAIALLQSRQQLELELLQIAQDFEGEDRDKRLALAKEQARLREREIEYQFQSKSLSQETELISQRLAIAQNLSNLGKINELELLQSQKQLEQEILEIKKQYPNLADQELRINLAKEQARLREIGIENNYNNQRWQRQQELFDMESRITEARATRLERSGQPFEAAAMREELAFRAELLRYEQEIEAIRQRYTDPADEQTRDELIRNAGILLELNLEQIDQEFKDLGETIRDTASGAFATFLEDTLTGTKSIGDAFLDMSQSILKSLAQIAARMAIGGLFRLFKIPIPGFADGGTIPNFAEGDTVKSAKVANLPFGNAQGNPFKGIQEALRKEGPQGVLAVFTPGEEILGLRTGEAQRYQRLKAQLGKNPLAKIGNFADGGTIGINESLLAGLNYGMPTAGRLPNNFGQTTQVSNYGGDRSVTVNVTAPNPSAFNASERQIGRTIAEYLSRV